MPLDIIFEVWISEYSISTYQANKFHFHFRADSRISRTQRSTHNGEDQYFIQEDVAILAGNHCLEVIQGAGRGTSLS
jgi:hypothetical protein